MQTVLITGGAGFLGINLVRYLLEKEFKVIVLDLEKFDYADVTDEVESIVGDIRKEEDLERAMNGVDLVVNCAAALPLYTHEQIMSTDYKGVEKVLTLAKRLGVQRVIQISSSAVYEIPDHHPLYETDNLTGVGPYGEAKVLAERVCEKFRKELIVPVLRPKSFVGKERLGVFAIYFDWIKSGCNLPIIGRGNNKYQLLDVEDLCETIYLCLTEEKEKVNDTFNVGAEKFTTMKQDFGAVIKYAKTGKKVIGTPAWLIIPVLKVLEFFNLSPLYKWVYETASKDSFISVEKIKKVLGFTPKYSTSEALIRSYQWYEQHCEDYVGKEGVSHRVPWKQGILGLVKKFF